MQIPDGVINQAAEAYFLASEAEMGFTDSTWFGESGATEETRKQFRWAAFQMAPIIAEWARREALKEAEDAVLENQLYDNTGDPEDDGYMAAISDVGDSIRALFQREF